MNKGDLIEGYTCIGIRYNVGTYQDKNKHEIDLLDLKGLPFKVEELNLKKESDFVINKKVPFVIVSVGNEGKAPWVKVDDKYLESKIAQELGLPEKEFLYIARESMNMAVTRHVAQGELSLDDIVGTALNIGKGIIENANKLKEYLNAAK